MSFVKELYDEPTYVNNRNVLQKHVKPATDWLRAYANNIGANFSTENLKVGITRLPTIYRPVIELSRRGIRAYMRPAGKVFGLYQPQTESMWVDYGVFSKRDPERQSLESAGIRYESPGEVVAHELVHHLQNKSGAMRRYVNRFGHWARDCLEGTATYITGKMFGKHQNLYRPQQEIARQLIASKGERRAVLGLPSYKMA